MYMYVIITILQNGSLTPGFFCQLLLNRRTIAHSRVAEIISLQTPHHNTTFCRFSVSCMSVFSSNDYDMCVVGKVEKFYRPNIHEKAFL